MINIFNNRFINNWKELSTAIIGFELEFYSNHSLIKTLELLNNLLNPIEVWAFNQYHSDFIVTDKKFKIEPDFSGGSKMIELITGPMQWAESKLILSKLLKFIKDNGYTTETCSLHINISFEDPINNIQVKDLNIVKLILDFDEEFVYNLFPNRKDNIYAKSINWILPFDNFINTESAMNNILQSLILPNDSKYYGINFTKKDKNYLEYRYVGGKDYETKYNDIITLLDYFIIKTRNALLNPINNEDLIKLNAYLDQNINLFKQYSTYDDFLINIDNIDILYDKCGEYEYINSNWDIFKKHIFNLIRNIKEIKSDEIITLNYNSQTNRLEVLNANIETLYMAKNYDFIECNINNAILFNCDIIDCNISNSCIYNTNIYSSEITSTKINNCKCTDYTELIDCIFDSGIVDCIFTSGIFRNGKITPDADISSEVKMAMSSDFWHISPNNNKKIK